MARIRQLELRERLDGSQFKGVFEVDANESETKVCCNYYGTF